jgi:hypothetical protein
MVAHFLCSLIFFHATFNVVSRCIAYLFLYSKIFVPLILEFYFNFFFLDFIFVPCDV